MANDPLDLSGRWDGTFAYPGKAGPDTPFVAEIDETGGGFSGSIAEPDIYRPSTMIEATLVGRRAGHSVDFTKSYRKAGFGYENPVDYVGKLSSDGMTITGVWSLLHMNGTFEMHREVGAQEERKQERAVEQPVTTEVR